MSTATASPPALHALYRLIAWGGAAFYVCVLPGLLKQYVWPFVVSFFKGNSMQIFAYTSLAAHFAEVIVLNAIYFAIYWLHWPVFEQFKIFRNKPWPWKSERQDERERFRATVKAAVGQVIFNNIFGSIPAAFLAQKLGNFPTDVDSFTVSPLVLLYQLAVCLFWEDTVFYFSHRALHHPKLYPHIHKRHHQFYHSISLASENAHFLEFLVGNLTPVLVGPMILQQLHVRGFLPHAFHASTFILWVWLRIAESADAHGGYAFPWSPIRVIPFGSSAEGHDFHHSHNTGIYATQFELWDYVFGTDKTFKEYMRQAKVEDEEKQRAAKLIPAASEAANEAAPAEEEDPSPSAAATSQEGEGKSAETGSSSSSGVRRRPARQQEEAANAASTSAGKSRSPTRSRSKSSGRQRSL